MNRQAMPQLRKYSMSIYWKNACFRTYGDNITFIPLYFKSLINVSESFKVLDFTLHIIMILVQILIVRYFIVLSQFASCCQWELLFRSRNFLSLYLISTSIQWVLLTSIYQSSFRFGVDPETTFSIQFQIWVTGVEIMNIIAFQK